MGREAHYLLLQNLILILEIPQQLLKVIDFLHQSSLLVFEIQKLFN